MSALPGRGQLRNRSLSAALVGLTLFVLDGSPVVAGVTATLFLTLTLGIDTVGNLFGDYADNLALGLLTLAFTGYIAVTAWWLPIVVGGALVGGWLAFDGFQHLRHSETRDEVTSPYSHNGWLVTGFVRAMGARLFEPFRL